METFFLDAIRAAHDLSDDDSAAAGGPLRVERMVAPTALHIDEAAADDEDAYPVTVKLRRLSEAEATPAQVVSNLPDGMFRSNLGGQDVKGADVVAGSGMAAGEEVVRCRYIVGCDGAHSWTRKALGKEL